MIINYSCFSDPQTYIICIQGPSRSNNEDTEQRKKVVSMGGCCIMRKRSFSSPNLIFTSAAVRRSARQGHSTLYCCTPKVLQNHLPSRTYSITHSPRLLFISSCLCSSFSYAFIPHKSPRRLFLLLSISSSIMLNVSIRRWSENCARRRHNIDWEPYILSSTYNHIKTIREVSSLFYCIFQKCLGLQERYISLSLSPSLFSVERSKLKCYCSAWRWSIQSWWASLLSNPSSCLWSYQFFLSRLSRLSRFIINDRYLFLFFILIIY